MRAIITPSGISGTIQAPASKSAMQRACAAALIRKGQTIIRNPGFSADDRAALEIIRQLGAEVMIEADQVKIKSNGVNPISEEIHCGESGLSIRMFASIAAISEKQIRLTGSGSLQKRPMDFFEEVFPQLDVHCKSNKGFLPLTIRGPMRVRNIEIDAPLSSQYLTGLLMAYSALNAEDVTIKAHQIVSKPYIGLTLELLEEFGLKVPDDSEFDDYTEFVFTATKKEHTPSDMIFEVEGDWSAAAFLFVAGAISGAVKVRGLRLDSLQADAAIMSVLGKAGADIDLGTDEILVKRNKLNGFTIDSTHAPDLFPPLVALAACCSGTSTISGVHRLTHKESNRAASLTTEFRKLGVHIELKQDEMIIEGGGQIKGAELDAHNDHRIAMAGAVAALAAEGSVFINGAESVNKSYPHFWKDIQKAGAIVSLENS